MFRLASLSCELRRCIAGALLSLPVAALASAPQETFLPPQNIPLPGTMTFGKLVVADVNGDHYDDIVAIGTDLVDAKVEIVLDVYLNDGKPRSSAETVTFTQQRLILNGNDNADAAADKVKFSGGFDLQVVDLDNDGKPDILGSFAATGEIFILWNQGNNAKDLFVAPDSDDPWAPSMIFFSPLAQRSGGDGVLGTPIYVAAADLKEGSGRKSIIAYHGGLQHDPNSKVGAPFDQLNYESLAILYPYELSARGFRAWLQRLSWPGCDLSFGAACPRWNDGLTVGASLYNFRPTDQLRLDFDSAASDILTWDSGSVDGANHYYTPAVLRPNASPGLQVLAGHGANGSDSIWLQGNGQAHEFVADNALKLMRRRTVVDAAITTPISSSVTVRERTAGATFGRLSTDATPLITAGGMRVVYDPSNVGTTIDQPVPEYLLRDGQIGGWLNWVSLNTGSALLSLSDYCRSPDPCARDLAWYHAPLDGSAAPASYWGGSHTLVMLDFAKETTTASGTQFEPFFQKPDDSRFQAFSIMGGSISHKPFIAAGHFASPTESALVMLDHADGSPTDPLWNHLALYRPDTAKTYRSPTPRIDGFAIGEYIRDGMVERVGSFDQGKKSMVILGAHFGTDTTDVVRYVTVRDASTHAVGGIFPVDTPELVKDTAMSGSTLTDGIVVPGLSTLVPGSYEVQVHNANAVSDWVALSVGNPRGIVATNYDWLAGRTCGLVPNTKDGNLWPKQIDVSVTGFADGELQAVRWIKSDGTAVQLSATGYATFDSASNVVTLTVPQGKLSDGSWSAFIKVADTWVKVPRVWNVVSDSATLDTCAAQVSFVNEEAYSQCTNDDYFLKPADYNVWPNHADDSFRYFGSGFVRNHIQTVALKQNGHRFFSQSVEVLSDNEIHVVFGDMSTKLTPNVPLDLYFYAADGSTVDSDGVPSQGGKPHWRTVRNGTCIPQLPEVGSFLNAGTGADGSWQSGDVIQVAAKNALYPIPSATKLLLKDAYGSVYMLENPRLPDDWYTHHYDNENLVLYFTVPEDLEAAKIRTGAAGGTAAYGAGGLVAVESRALATAAISEDALAVMLAETSAPLVVAGATATGVLVYTGVVPKTWVSEKLELFVKKITDSPVDLSAGLATDNQPRRPDQLFAVSFVSQPSQYFETGPLNYVIVKDQSAMVALKKARYAAIPAFMAANYAKPGSVDMISDAENPVPSRGASAAITSIRFVGPGDTNIKGLKFSAYKSRYNVHLECADFIVDTYADAQVPPELAGLRRNSVLWRRRASILESPPIECGSHFVDQLGEETYFLQTGYYFMDDKNDYTRF